MEQSMERWSDLVMQPRVDPGAIVHRHVSMSHRLELTSSQAVHCDPADVNIDKSAADALSPAPVEIDYDAVARLNMIEGLRGDTFDTSIAAHDEFVERVSSIVKRPPSQWQVRTCEAVTLTASVAMHISSARQGRAPLCRRCCQSYHHRRHHNGRTDP